MSKIILVENNLVENHTGRMENWSKIHEFLSKIRRKLKDLCKPAAGPQENHLTRPAPVRSKRVQLSPLK